MFSETVEQILDGFGYGATLGTACEAFGGDAHHLAHLARAGGTGFSDDCAELGVEFLC